MRKYILLLSTLLLLLPSCQRFSTWKEYNEEWLIAKRAEIKATSPYEVVEYASGIIVEKIHTGYGAVPKPYYDPDLEISSYVRVNYKGWLADGTLFDTGEEVNLVLSGTVQGWQDVLSTMPQGSLWKIYLPADKGYGAEGSKDAYGNFSVPPYSVMVFEIDLVEVHNF